MECYNPTNGIEFKILNDALIAAIVYPLVTMQKTIHMLLAQYRLFLAKIEENEEEDVNEGNTTMADTSTRHVSNTEKRTDTRLQTPTHRHKYYANKCRLLKAKDIIHRLIICATTQNLCSGGSNEVAKHRKVL